MATVRQLEFVNGTTDPRRLDWPCGGKFPRVAPKCDVCLQEYNPDQLHIHAYFSSGVGAFSACSEECAIRKAAGYQ